MKQIDLKRNEWRGGPYLKITDYQQHQGHMWLTVMGVALTALLKCTTPLRARSRNRVLLTTDELAILRDLRALPPSFFR